MAVIRVALSTVNVVAGVPPNATALTPMKLVPVMVTDCPPAVLPMDGATPVIVAGAARVTTTQ
ncbi:hypothetical protein D3C80_2166620 [compost metagenome]